jgi:rubrerythrin
MEEKNLLDLIDTAIKREEAAYTFYMDIHGKVEDSGVKDTLEWIANEEIKHKAFLVNFRDGNHSSDTFQKRDVKYYKIAEHMEEPETEGEIKDVEIYLVAAHREARSHKFYSELADLQPEGDTKEVLLKMANEELKHKEKMEYLYANTAFPQTDGG